MSDTYNRSGASPPASKAGAPVDGSSSAGSRTLEPTYEGDFVIEGSLPLECGRVLICPTLHYAVYGRLNAAKDNAVLVCHALSGSARVGNWWPEIFAPGAVLSLERDFVICINLLGSCYGSTGPGSMNPEMAKVPARISPSFRFATMSARRRACSIPLASGVCGWCWAVPSAVCRRLIGRCFIPTE